MNNREWSRPQVYKIDKLSQLTELSSDLGGYEVADNLAYIADDLYELNNPDKLDDTQARASFKEVVLAEGSTFGKWVAYPWLKSLVQFPDDDDYYNLRTFRNRDLIKDDEQAKLKSSKIAVFGLSVGSNVVESSSQMGIGQEWMLFDFDRLSPTNLNRIRSSMAHVGLLKTTIAGRKMAELDPYINQEHYTDGYNDSIDDILRNNKPDIIIEEVDDVESKAKIRRIASELKVPLVMAGDVGDRSTLSIERYDQPKTIPFNGKLNNAEYESLVDGSLGDKDGVLMKMVGIKNLSPRLIESSMKRGVELAGLPQLGATATAGGALASVAIRDILLGRHIDSSDRVVDLRKSVGSSAPTSLSESISIIRDFIKYRKNK